jgi:hypothetical protein
VAIDMIRCAKLARTVASPGRFFQRRLTSASTRPEQMTDDQAYAALEAFIQMDA